MKLLVFCGVSVKYRSLSFCLVLKYVHDVQTWFTDDEYLYNHLWFYRWSTKDPWLNIRKFTSQMSHRKNFSPSFKTLQQLWPSLPGNQLKCQRQASGVQAKLYSGTIKSFWQLNSSWSKNFSWKQIGHRILHENKIWPKNKANMSKEFFMKANLYMAKELLFKSKWLL